MGKVNYFTAVVQQDLDSICSDSLDWSLLEGKSVLIIGANSMIGTYVVYTLMHLVLKFDMDISVIASSRNQQSAKELFGCFEGNSHFTQLIQDVCLPLTYTKKVDYIFHLAGNASPYYIMHYPVDIMRSNIIGMFNVLEYAREREITKIIFGSTREVYGANLNEDSLTETSFGQIDCLESRSCYPESKRAVETLCKSYSVQYGVHFNTVRIAHAYGPGIKLKNDGRVMADFLDCVAEGKDIKLNSLGEALRAFCYISDAITGLMRVLLYGKEDEAYNLANETEEISVRNLATLLVSMVPEKQLSVIYPCHEIQRKAYCSYKRVRLNVEKLIKLGWRPTVSLKQGLERIIETL